MVGPSDLSKLVPGFDFLQGLMKGAGAGLPNIGQWIAPTLDPEELNKRIQELKTVHFWLEQNAKLLATTIQALEVQRMTLATLQTMNMPLAPLRDALKAGASAAAEVSGKPKAADAPPGVPAAPSALGPGDATRSTKAAKASKPKPTETAAAGTKPAVDPMQWWGALTQQFAELAGNAMREGSAEMARSLAGSVAKKAMAAPAKAVSAVGAAAQKVASMAAAAPAGAPGRTTARTAPAPVSTPARSPAPTPAGAGRAARKR
jgi:hypothetical protein